ncbi:hypothetical protein Tco_1346211 [Tanacetum coccineum]
MGIHTDCPYDDEGWNDLVIPEEGSLDYKNLDIEQLLGIMEYKVDALIMDAISLVGRNDDVFRITSNEMHQLPPKHHSLRGFEHIVTNFIFDQEERVKQLEEYMEVIENDFMQLSSEVIRRLKEKKRENENKIRKIVKITRANIAIFSSLRNLTDFEQRGMYLRNNCAKNEARSAGRLLRLIRRATGKRVGRGGRGRRPREGNDERVDDLNGQGNEQGCLYKKFLACNPKEDDGKGGVVVLTRWIEKMESVHDMSGCSIDQKVKYTAGSFVESNLVTPESRMIERYVYGLAPQIHRMVAATEPKTMNKAVQISGALTDEAARNGSIKKVEKRANMGETSKDKNGRDDNKRTRTGNIFATTVNPVRRENMGTWSKCTTYNSYHAPRGPCRTCFNSNRLGHLAKDYRGMLRNVNPVNARNLTVRACYECGSTDYVRSACSRLNRA